VTGHIVCYVLAFGLGGVIIAFLIIGPVLAGLRQWRRRGRFSLVD